MSCLLSLVVHTIIPALRRLGQEDGRLKVSMGYIVRPCFKQNERDIRRKKSGRKRTRRRKERRGVIMRIKRLYSFINVNLLSFERYSTSHHKIERLPVLLTHTKKLVNVL